MKTIRLILILGTVLYVWGCVKQTQTPVVDKQRPALSSLPAKYQTLLTTWLNQDCRVDSVTIEKDMASAGPILEDALWEAFSLGPTEEDRADLKNSLRESYALRLRWLMQKESPAVDSTFSKRLIEESEEQFFAKEMAKLNGRWRDAAVAGLGFVCTNKSLERLRLITKDDQNSSSIAAGEALRASGDCNRSR